MRKTDYLNIRSRTDRLKIDFFFWKIEFISSDSFVLSNNRDYFSLKIVYLSFYQERSNATYFI